MARPREFDVDDALDKATALFWQNGYDETSLADLTRTIGISPPSFYAAFGSKEELFEKVVERYSAAQSVVIDEALAQPDPVRILRALMDGVAVLLTNSRYAQGCLIMNSALPVSGGAHFRKRFAAQRRQLRQRLEARIRATDRTGLAEADAILDAGTIARLVLSTYWGMAVEAQSGATRRDLRATGEALVRLIERSLSPPR